MIKYDIHIREISEGAYLSVSPIRPIIIFALFSSFSNSPPDACTAPSSVNTKYPT